jgi:uncharacterized small protein (DUF1192 family)
LRSSSSLNKGNETTIAFLRQENERLNSEINTLRSSQSSSSGSKGDPNAIAFLKQENERLNGLINQYEIELKTAKSKIQ